MNLLVLQGASQNDVLTLMAEQLAAAFNEIDVQASMLPVTPADPPSRLRDAVAAGAFDGVFSYASYGADALRSDGRPLYDGLKYGFIGWNVDHPSYQFGRMTAPLARRLTICASNDHFAFMDVMGAAGRTLPMLPGVASTDAGQPWAERSVDLLVAASWLGRPQRWWADAKGTPAYALLEGIFERLCADPKLDLLRAYTGAVEATGIQPPFTAHLSDILGKLMTHVRQIDRLRLLGSLLASNVRFTLCGDGWSEVLGPSPRITYLPSLDFARLQALYRECRVVLNMNAANGGSERAVAAMAAGAAVVSDYGALLYSTFGSAIRFYDRTDTSTAIGCVNDLLDGDRGEAVAAKARGVVLREHLWRHKAEQIAAAVEGAEE